MIAVPFSWEHPAPSYQHASAQAYAAFLREYLGESRSVPFYLRMREQFIQAYPDLQAWFAAPHLLQISLVFVNTLMVQEVLKEEEWLKRFTPEDYRGLTPLFYSHVEPYGRLTLDMTQRLALA